MADEFDLTDEQVLSGLRDFIADLPEVYGAEDDDPVLENLPARGSVLDTQFNQIIVKADDGTIKRHDLPELLDPSTWDHNE